MSLHSVVVFYKTYICIDNMQITSIELMCDKVPNFPNKLHLDIALTVFVSMGSF